MRLHLSQKNTCWALDIPSQVSTRQKWTLQKNKHEEKAHGSYNCSSPLYKHSRERQRLRAINIQIHTVHYVIRKDWGPLEGLQGNWSSLGGGYGAFLQEVGPKVKQTNEFFTRKEKTESWSYRQIIPVNSITWKKPRHNIQKSLHQGCSCSSWAFSPWMVITGYCTVGVVPAWNIQRGTYTTVSESPV